MTPVSCAVPHLFRYVSCDESQFTSVLVFQQGADLLGAVFMQAVKFVTYTFSELLQGGG